MKLFVLILAVIASEKKENAENDLENGERHGNIPILVKIEEDEYAKVNNKSKFIGVSYNKNTSNWYVLRRSQNEKRNVYNGCYDDEETAAHASDTLARQLMENGGQKLKLNFPDDHTEVHREFKMTASKFIGICYCEKNSSWLAYRRSKNENKQLSNGHYDDEETAAHASDTLARKLMKNGEQKHKLNFPDDHTEIYPEKKRFTSKFIGVSFCEKKSKWRAQRWSKDENKQFSNGHYDDEETAAHASDTLARKLMENGEQKLNFPGDHIEVYPAEQKKRKRPKDLNLEHPQINRAHQIHSVTYK